MDKESVSSGRVYGIWSLILALLAFVGLFKNSSVSIICELASLFVWQLGCGARGEKYWPADVRNLPYLRQSVLMMCAAGMLLGLSLSDGTYLLAGYAGFISVTVCFSLDLIIYDTKERYEHRVRSQRSRQITITNGPKYRFRFSWIRKISLLTWITAFMAMIVFVSEYKKFISQITEWISVVMN